MVKYFWVLGMAGSGKTYYTNQLKMLGNVYRDADYQMDELKKDKDFKYRKMLKDGFVILDSGPYVNGFIKMLTDLKKEKGNAVIEMATQLDNEGICDFSFKRFLLLMPDEIIFNSVFIYLSCPFKKRVKRKENVVPREAMERYFKQDDALLYLNYYTLPYSIVKNY
jgi:hypothetical protein